jgi:hypothetical protein
VGVSPQAGWQTSLPQTHCEPQSTGQVVWSSPHWGWQKASPQTEPPGQLQSTAQLSRVSPQPASQTPLPQKASGGHAQSPGQVPGSSPHSPSQTRLPQVQLPTQVFEGPQMVPWSLQLAQATPLVPHASHAVPG